ncbi:MAG TPA: hypothetical protein VIJ66_06015, partial [Solirubrobacteraceae bacterium]
MGAVTEDLVIAVEAMGLPQAAAEVDTLSGSVDGLAASAGRADVALGGGAAGGGRKGLMGGLMSMKALFAGLGVFEAVKQFSSFQSSMERLQTQAGLTGLEVEKLAGPIKSMS